ncbi:MAG: GUN4 domain-containing protein [Xenococcaceae cyanobacterium MO_188.B29]|nr:GUN4 domain-containing protein [Xenococcaceae cyanobacterium MO_188.B29]
MNSDRQFDYDVFLCHNNEYKRQVRIIKQELEKHNIRCFLDESMSGGEEWKDKIDRAMSNSKSVAIFVGSHGLGDYQKEEIEDLHLRLDFNGTLVIPVLLNNATQDSEDDFRSSSSINWIWDRQRVDFRPNGEDKNPAKKLIDAIRGTNSSNNQERSTESETEEDDLSTERGVDYTRLRDYLKAGFWKDADEETLRLMLQAAGRQKKGWLNDTSVKNFPCTDLRTIDQLWVKYSNGHFGFSMQKQIWISVVSVGGYLNNFGYRVGWLKNGWLGGEWLPHTKLTFSLSAPAGHLPSSNSHYENDYYYFEGFKF